MEETQNLVLFPMDGISLIKKKKKGAVSSGQNTAHYTVMNIYCEARKSWQQH